MGGVNRAAPDLLHVALIADGAEHQLVVDFVNFALGLPRRQQQQAAVVGKCNHRTAIFEAVFNKFVSLLDTFVPVIRAIGRQWFTPNKRAPQPPIMGESDP